MPAKAQQDGARSAAPYNLFRRRGKDDLVVAVPQDRAVPPFLTEEAWCFDGLVQGMADAPPGFDGEAARHGAGLNGYYLFLAHGRAGGLIPGTGPAGAS